jgi:hypothetical protein
MTGTEIVTLCLHFLSCGLNHLFRNIIEIFTKKLPGPLHFRVPLSNYDDIEHGNLFFLSTCATNKVGRDMSTCGSVDAEKLRRVHWESVTG